MVLGILSSMTRKYFAFLAILASQSVEARDQQVHGLTGYSEIKRQQEAVQRNLENSEDAALAGTYLEEINQVENEREPIRSPSKNPSNAAYQFESLPPGGTASLPQSAVDPEDANGPRTQPMGNSALDRISYFRRLGNSYGCFRSFLTGVFRARFRRDEEIVACASTGMSSCESQAASIQNTKVRTLQDDFMTCLDQPR